MYTLVVIFLGIWALVIIVGFYRKYYTERRRIGTWLTSQPAEALISQRRRAAERGRALLDEQIDCDDFIDEFGNSEDPEIQKLVNIVEQIATEEFLNSYKRAIEKRIVRLEGGKSAEKKLSSS
jgi:hypothetical protein